MKKAKDKNNGEANDQEAQEILQIQKKDSEFWPKVDEWLASKRADFGTNMAGEEWMKYVVSQCSQIIPLLNLDTTIPLLGISI